MRERNTPMIAIMMNIADTFARTYANNGQHLEQCARYFFTGEIAKADNKPHTDGGDIDDIQIKTARATVCKGLDIEKYLEADGAKRYAYITKDLTMYIMNRSEYIEFCTTFGTATKESAKNGGADKIRLKPESKNLLTWLANHA